jgi:hypothetical protein
MAKLVKYNEDGKTKKELYDLDQYRVHRGSFVKTHKSKLLRFDMKTGIFELWGIYERFSIKRPDFP